MKKTAAQIADDILWSVKLAEAFDELEKEAGFGSGMMIGHFFKQMVKRLSQADQKWVLKGLKGVDDTMRARRRNGKGFPKEWWIPIKDDKGNLIGRVAGENASVKTFYNAQMQTPRGSQLRR